MLTHLIVIMVAYRQCCLMVTLKHGAVSGLGNATHAVTRHRMTRSFSCCNFSDPDPWAEWGNPILGPLAPESNALTTHSPIRLFVVMKMRENIYFKVKLKMIKTDQFRKH